jgi:alpha-beta hydrolase superfamily lysophospholipase
MQHQDGTFKGAAGHTVYYQYWSPEQKAKAVVLVVHGAGEHSARYSELAQRFCDAGYAVAALDHIGHGKSSGSYGHMDDLQHHLDTLDIFRQRVTSEFTGLPMILLGHSMGGLISACYLLKEQKHFIGCALSGPAIKTELEPGVVQIAIIRTLALLLPKLGVMQLDAAGVSRDPEVVAAYKADPLINQGKMSARFVSELFRGMNLIQEEAASVELPLLIMHGGGDLMTAPSGSRFLHDAVASNDKTLKIYPELYHEIFKEPEREQVFADLISWCDARTS